MRLSHQNVPVLYEPPIAGSISEFYSDIKIFAKQKFKTYDGPIYLFKASAKINHNNLIIKQRIIDYLKNEVIRTFTNF